LTPLIRDFYYQPMLYDLLEKSIENDIITYSMAEDKTNKIIEKKALLSEQDDLFTRFDERKRINTKRKFFVNL